MHGSAAEYVPVACNSFLLRSRDLVFFTARLSPFYTVFKCFHAFLSAHTELIGNVRRSWSQRGQQQYTMGAPVLCMCHAFPAFDYRVHTLCDCRTVRSVLHRLHCAVVNHDKSSNSIHPFFASCAGRVRHHSMRAGRACTVSARLKLVAVCTHINGVPPCLSRCIVPVQRPRRFVFMFNIQYR